MLPEHLDGSLFGPDNPCFGCSPNHPYGFHLKVERDGDGVLAALHAVRQHHQGPPGLMHGGLVTTLADEIAAWTLVVKLEKFGFTTSFEGRFRAPVRIGKETLGRGVITKQTSRVVRLGVTISQGDVVCFTGDLAFVLLDKGGAEKLLQGPLPEAWKRFAR